MLILVLKFDRRGERMDTTYDHEITVENPAWIPAVEDFLGDIPGAPIARSGQRVVWKRMMKIDEQTGDTVVTVCADPIMDLLRRRQGARMEQRAKEDIWTDAKSSKTVPS